MRKNSRFASRAARRLAGLMRRAGEYARDAVPTFAGAVPAPGLSGGDAALRRLEIRIARLASSMGGVAGVAAVHVESGRGVSFNGRVRLPMASTVKVPLAIQILSMVDAGQLTLDRMVPLTAGDLHPGSGIIWRHFRLPGLALSIRNLLELSLIVSDNTAADVLFDVAGGAAALNDRLRVLGHTDISVDRPTIRLIADLSGIGDLPQDVSLTRKSWGELRTAVPVERRRDASRAFLADTRDTTTPEAMARLLAQVCRGEALGRESTAILGSIMSRCDSGHLHRLLPAGTRVAHKTGTLAALIGPGARRVLTADVGIMDLPGRAGRIAMAVFILASPRREAAQGRMISRIARSVYDHFAAEPEPAAREDDRWSNASL